MTLHKAIEKLLRQTGRPMMAREIADELNKNKWYVKGDKSLIKPSQITARVDDHHELFDIDRSLSPLLIKLHNRQLKVTFKPVVETTKRTKINKPIVQTNLTHRKMSFDPISNSNTTILILGTMPGDKSLELGKYYRHSRNKFWKIISTITNSALPLTYPDKKKLLLKSRIGIWDVAHQANRKGSLDNAIENEEPNDLDGFILKHRNLKVIGFNGKASEVLYDKYFDRKSNVKYISLPSTSPANTRIDFENICKIWQQILIK
jgi:hypoxanthine-DNA glycosylase